jgi:hypothetical protein
MRVALALAIQIVSERYTKPQSLLVRIRPYSYLFAGVRLAALLHTVAFMFYRRRSPMFAQ